MQKFHFGFFPKQKMLFLVKTKIEKETVSKNSNLIPNQSDFAINNLKRLKL